MIEIKPQERLAIFDLDGTLTNTETYSREAVVDTVAHHFGFSGYIELMLEQYNGVGDAWRKIFEKLGNDPSKFTSFEADIKFRINSALAETGIHPMPGAIEHLRYYQEQGAPVGVGSNSHRDYVVGRLHTSGLYQYVNPNAIVGSNEVEYGRAKPKPDIFLKVAERAGVSASSCVVIGDTPADMIAAFRAGMTRILVTDQEYKGIPSAKPHLHAKTLSEIDPDQVLHLAMRNNAAIKPRQRRKAS